MAQETPLEQQSVCCQRAEVIFGNVPTDWLLTNPYLRWLQLNSAGLDPYHRLDWKQLPLVTVTNLHGFFGQPCAETAVAGILALYRGISTLISLQQWREWMGGKLRPSLQLLAGKRVLILGGGTIGQRVGRLLDAFNCSITYIRRSQSPTLADLDNLLPEADIVVATLPETTGVLDANQLSRMKAGSLLVNVRRPGIGAGRNGPRKLTNGHLAGAVLDVTLVELLPADSPLWHLPNLVLTQHTGGGYADEKRDKVQFFTQNLRRYRTGEPPINVVIFKV